MVKISFPAGFSPEYTTVTVKPQTETREIMKRLTLKFGLPDIQHYSLYKVLSREEMYSISEDTFLGDVLAEMEEEASRYKEAIGDYPRIEFRKKIWLDPSEEEAGNSRNSLVFAQVCFASFFPFFSFLFFLLPPPKDIQPNHLVTPVVGWRLARFGC